MARSKHNNDSHRFYTWLDSAQEDLLAAQILMSNFKCYNLAAFHCQQTLEKILKAYILFENNRLYDGHNLLWLCKQAAKLDDTFFCFLDACAKMNHFYIEARYPSDLFLEITKEDIKELVIDTKSIFDKICMKMYI